jgi:hypothetical protein
LVSGENNLRSLIADLVLAKRNRRQQLARLPFEQKIQILIRLQKMAHEIRVKSGRTAPKVWDIPGGI